MRTRIIFWVGLLALMSPSVASAAPITIPTGLNPGDTYFLAFVTAGTRDATNPDILAYDAFVTSQANLEPTLLALGTTWKAIGSTDSVDAVTHIGVTGPVYNLAGELVATGSADMFDGNLLAPILYNQFGAAHSTGVWTGTEFDGQGVGEGVFALTLGAQQSLATFGSSSATGTEWLLLSFASTFDLRSIYGISGPLTVPTAVPEPSTLSLMLGALLLRGPYRRWRHRLATPATQSDPASR